MIFVFGSNLAGRHGMGAALYARRKYGAEYGIGVGRTGDAYAIPTKDENLNILPMNRIDGYIYDFCRYAAENHADMFLLTPVGCGLAGYKKKDIAAIFKIHGLTRNVVLSSTWITD